MKKMKFTLNVLLMLGCTAFVSCTSTKQSPVKLNDIQVIGSHNSYKKRIDRPIWEMMYQEDSAMAVSLDYAHIPLVDQLNLGLRALELDIFHDPEGGRFSNPLGLTLQEEAGITAPEFDSEQRLDEKGMKLFHIQDLDFRSDFPLFKDALNALKNWSHENKGHIPVFITMNAKDQLIDRPRFTKPLPFTKTALDSIDLEISEVFGAEMLITPDMVRGNAQTLEDAILTNGWPGLDQLRGRFMFVLDEGGKKRSDYIAGHQSLKGRKMFVNAPAGTAESAFIILNNPIADQQKIKDLVEQGYIVRTRADESTIEAKNNDYKNIEKAIESGAHVISTDYYVPDPFIGTGFKIAFQNGKTYSRNVKR